ncbi:MAG TPA: response regulator transcription factor [Actinomycetota bacterium]|nr:response regulator transcription factor [Actinomycetota bacterium]
MKILLCDDHRLLVETFASLMQASGHEIVDCVLDPAAAVEVVAREPVDVCVMDMSFDGLEDAGIEAIGAIIAASPTTKVAVLSASGEPDLIARALGAGASAYLLKSEDVDRILSTIAALEFAETDDVRVAAPRSPEPTQAPHLRFMTPREREVLTRLVQGQSTVAIAREMGVAYSTARTHIQNVLTKLGVHSKLAAVTYAVRNGLVAPTPRGSENRRSAV